MTYRITRTVVRGQFANDSCFALWLATTPGVAPVKMADDLHIGATQAELLDPSLSKSPNDFRLYLWRQDAQVVTPKCPNSDPDLVTYGGKNGWDTQAEAQAVFDREFKGTAVIAAAVNEANAAAVGPANVVGGAVKELAGDIGKAADAAGKSILSSPWTWGVGIMVGGVMLYKIFK